MGGAEYIPEPQRPLQAASASRSNLAEQAAERVGGNGDQHVRYGRSADGRTAFVRREQGRAANLRRDGPLRPFTSRSLIGREAELEELAGLLREPPAVAVVEGEAGVGKTRLVREALAEPELCKRQILIGYCQPLREPLPFGPMIEALRGVRGLRREGLGTIAGALQALVPELSAQLPPALEPLGDMRAERHRVFRAILEVLGVLGPAVCVLEDLHWSDSGTVDMLRFLLSQPPANLALVLTFRTDEPASFPGLVGLLARLPPSMARTRVSLAPLGQDEVRGLAASILDLDEVSDEFAAYLHERTLGLPFAVEEVLRLLIDRRDIVQREGRWTRRKLEELGVPWAVRNLILERLARLSPDAARVARAAAVAARAASTELLASVASLPPDRVSAGLSETLELGLLAELEERRFGFRHVLAREAVYQQIAAPERQRLHLRAAQTLEEAGDPLSLAQIAHHFQAAGAHRKWLRAAEAAADLAISFCNEGEACDLLIAVLSCSDLSAVARTRMAVKLARAALASLNHDEALPVLRQLLDSGLLPVGARGEVRMYVGLLLDNQAGQAAAGLAELRRALVELRRRPELAARAMSVLAVPMSTERDVAEHLSWMRRALAAAERASEPRLKLAVLVNRATVLLHVGDHAAWDAVLDLPQATAATTEKRELVRANGNFAHACTCLGHYARAQSFLDRGRELSAEIHDPYLELALASTGLLLDWLRGHWNGLEPRASRLLRSAADLPLIVAEAELVLGRLHLARGELREARTSLTTAHATALAGGSVPTIVAAVGGLARMSLTGGDAEAAAEQALHALELVRRKGIWVWATDIALVLTDALVATERAQEATAIITEIARGVHGRPAPAAHAAVSTCRAVLRAAANAEQGAAAFARSEREWRALPDPYQQARCREARSLLLLALGQRSGEKLLLGTLSDFEALGASWDVARIRRALREHGLLAPWRGGRHGYGNALSPREEEVVRLAARGLTNKEIAQELVLSPRTVEDHLIKARHKLGVSSKRALADLIRG